MATKTMFSISAISGVALLAAALFGAVEVADTRYVGMDQFTQLSVEVYYGRYYDTIDRIRDAEARGDEEFVTELERSLEMIRAKICKVEPDWERCLEHS